MDLQAFQSQFNPFFHEILKEKLAVYQGFTHDPLQPAYIDQLLKLSAGGKRIRPYLCALLAQGNTGSTVPDVTLRIAAALELFHLFALVHDDIIDHADTRHEVATMHTHTATLLNHEQRKGNTEHIGVSLALLWGDVLLTLVHELVHDAASQLPDNVLHSVRSTLCTMTHEVIAGQMIDVSLPTLSVVNDDLLYQKNLLKTARYTFVRPMQIGALLAGLDDAVLAWCQTFGETVGVAFQMQDDLLNITQSVDTAGKDAFSDVSEGQPTFFTQYVFVHGTAQQQSTLQSFFWSLVLEKDHHILVKLFEESGALDAGKQRIQESFTEAENMFATVDISGVAIEGLQALLDRLRSRVS